jgi:hypothetical protein
MRCESLVRLIMVVRSQPDGVRFLSASKRLGCSHLPSWLPWPRPTRPLALTTDVVPPPRVAPSVLSRHAEHFTLIRSLVGPVR